MLVCIGSAGTGQGEGKTGGDAAERRHYSGQSNTNDVL